MLLVLANSMVLSGRLVATNDRNPRCLAKDLSKPSGTLPRDAPLANEFFWD